MRHSKPEIPVAPRPAIAPMDATCPALTASHIANVLTALNTHTRPARIAEGISIFLSADLSHQAYGRSAAELVRYVDAPAHGVRPLAATWHQAIGQAMESDPTFS